MATASARRARAWAGVTGEPVDAGGPGTELDAALEVDAPDDHVAAGGQVAHEHVEAAALARAGDTADRPWRRRNSTRHGEASSNGPSSMGSVIEETDGPGPRDRVGVRVDFQHPQLAPVGQVVGGRVDADRAPEGAERRLERRDLAITSVMVWPRASRTRARQPHTSTTADMTCDPASPTALAMSGQASSLRSTRTLARRRRCVHHGTASDRAADDEHLRQRCGPRANAVADAEPRPGGECDAGRVCTLDP